jgi:nicotinate-nucleotide pyrophosphorylase (carboxylating)
VEAIVSRALAEDIGNGDLTTTATVPECAFVSGLFRAKADGVLCGLDVAGMVFDTLGGGVEWSPERRDGDPVEDGQTIATISGPARTILSGERVALNLMQRMSGIATLTARFQKRVSGTNARIVDTRKTAPGLRLLDKFAVRCGGGRSHRFGLFDGILIKENHIIAAGGIRNAVQRAREQAPHGMKMEIEIEVPAQIEVALDAGTDIILLDNMDIKTLTDAVRTIHGRALTEASGGVTLDSVRAVAQSGVDYISVGALTHSVQALDISLRVAPGWLP